MPVRTRGQKFRGRLPAYFSTVVSSEQRQKVYDTQATYFERIAALEKRILELHTKQDQEVDAILSAEQLAEIRSCMRLRPRNAEASRPLRKR